MCPEILHTTQPVAATPLVLTLPGWQGSGAAHWQSRWEALHSAVRVQQHDWHHPLRGDWICQLEETVVSQIQTHRPLLLAAHSLGCHLVAAWAQVSRHTQYVAGALLVAPPDLMQGDLPDPLVSWRKPMSDARDSPHTTPTNLPFPAVVVASSNDPFDIARMAYRMSQDWGAGFVSLGAKGHINADSQLGDWQEGWALLQSLAHKPMLTIASHRIHPSQNR